jgi:hypothetical protein
LKQLKDVSELAFDHRMKCVDDRIRHEQEVTDLVNSIELFFIQLGRLAFSFPFWQFYPTKDWRLFEKSGKFIYDIVRKHIKTAQLKLDAADCVVGVDSTKKKSILAEFLSRKDKYDLDLEDVVAIMTDFLIAGVDTVIVLLI